MTNVCCLVCYNRRKVKNMHEPVLKSLWRLIFIENTKAKGHIYRISLSSWTQIPPWRNIQIAEAIEFVCDCFRPKVRSNPSPYLLDCVRWGSQHLEKNRLQTLLCSVIIELVDLLCSLICPIGTRVLLFPILLQITISSRFALTLSLSHPLLYHTSNIWNCQKYLLTL